MVTEGIVTGLGRIGSRLDRIGSRHVSSVQAWIIGQGLVLVQVQTNSILGSAQLGQALIELGYLICATSYQAWVRSSGPNAGQSVKASSNQFRWIGSIQGATTEVVRHGLQRHVLRTHDPKQSRNTPKSQNN
ncbi:hypothetical protein V6N13_047105 [Hibiscus sabdariffa]|uniref:Uncharacterized protein n=2 Tax=Hibiscus sabdariffa TaxID=183260 RepID=A0ABR1ZYE5_9ROSI